MCAGSCVPGSDETTWLAAQRILPVVIHERSWSLCLGTDQFELDVGRWES